ncbi:S49 family peptidase [Luteimonas sp. MJ174]|uniref:S49 family peptidase n=1 Tax=Luteimonas sp. MJ174 TaxID=3129237 RepID=UPI0031BAC9AD
MNKATRLLSRLAGRSNPAPVVSALAFAALNRPLLAHPAMAQSLINGYLTGAITSDDTMLATERVPLQVATEQGVTTVGTIGVLPITGGLVNRPMPGASGPGPMSYVAIREQFDDLLADDDVTAIVLRIESPGGMASGCFDLVDHLYSSRGAKPMIALVDDYAYSAAYAIASACDQIWVSRTGGAGSVGVCCSHEDWSGYNERMGVRVTEIYAGARKVDFSPDAPLSDEAKNNLQQWANDDYDVFVATVARNRGMPEEAVRATEAGIFFGQRAIDAGVADRLGTWDNLVADLGAPGADAPEQPGDDGEQGTGMEGSAATITGDGTGEALPALESAAAGPLLEAVVDTLTPEALMTPEQRNQFARGAMADAAAAANLPGPVALALVQCIGHDTDIGARVEHATAVIDLVAASGLGVDPTPYVRKNTELAQVRADLLEAKAKADEAVPVQTTLPANSAEKPKPAHRLNPSSIYRKRG